MKLGTSRLFKPVMAKRIKRLANTYNAVVEASIELEGLIDERLLKRAHGYAATVRNLLLTLYEDFESDQVTVESEIVPYAEFMPLFGDQDDEDEEDEPPKPRKPTAKGQAASDREESKRALNRELETIEAEGNKLIELAVKAGVLPPKEEAVEVAPEASPMLSCAPEKWSKRYRWRGEAWFDGVPEYVEFENFPRTQRAGSSPEAMVEITRLSRPDAKVEKVRVPDAHKITPTEWTRNQAMIPAEPVEAPASIAAKKPPDPRWGDTAKIETIVERSNGAAAFLFTFLASNPSDPPGFTVLADLPSFLGFLDDSETFVVPPEEAKGKTLVEWCNAKARRLLRDQEDKLFVDAMARQAAEILEDAKPPAEAKRLVSTVAFAGELLDALYPPDGKGSVLPATRRWDQRVKDGASDDELRSAISTEFGRWTRETLNKRGVKFSVAAGAGRPGFWGGGFKPGGRATYKDEVLVDVVRKLLKIPQPIETAKPKPKQRGAQHQRRSMA